MFISTSLLLSWFNFIVNSTIDFFQLTCPRLIAIFASLKTIIGTLIKFHNADNCTIGSLPLDFTVTSKCYESLWIKEKLASFMIWLTSTTRNTLTFLFYHCRWFTDVSDSNTYLLHQHPSGYGKQLTANSSTNGRGSVAKTRATPHEKQVRCDYPFTLVTLWHLLRALSSLISWIMKYHVLKYPSKLRICIFCKKKVAFLQKINKLFPILGKLQKNAGDGRKNTSSAWKPALPCSKIKTSN